MERWDFRTKLGLGFGLVVLLTLAMGALSFSALETVVEEGTSVAIFGRCTGTHQATLRAPGGDVAATGRELDLPISTFYEVRDGKILSARLTFDQGTLLDQLGLMPARATA